MISQWLADEKHFVDFGVNVGVLMVALMGFVGIAYALRSWYQDDADPAESRHELLLQFRELNRQGHLTADEFRSIKGRLVEGADGSAADRKTGICMEATEDEAPEAPPGNPSED